MDGRARYWTFELLSPAMRITYDRIEKTLVEQDVYMERDNIIRSPSRPCTDAGRVAYANALIKKYTDKLTKEETKDG